MAAQLLPRPHAITFTSFPSPFSTLCSSVTHQFLPLLPIIKRTLTPEFSSINPAIISASRFSPHLFEAFSAVVNWRLLPMMSVPFLLPAACLSVLLTLCTAQEPVLIGPLSELTHDVSGTVYALNDRTLEIRNFNYDGAGPAGVYWVDLGDRATAEGVIAPVLDSCEEVNPLGRMEDATVRVELPKGYTLSNIGYFSIWCITAREEFGGIRIDASNLSPSPPEAQPQCSQPMQRILIGELSELTHDVSGTVYALNDRTLQIENFNYDGAGPAGVYWVDLGDRATADGVIAPELDSCEEVNPLGRMEDATVRIELPNGYTLSDIGYFSIWCITAREEFGGIRINAADLPETPLAVQPQCIPEQQIPVRQGYSCESLNPTYQVRWQLDSEREEINIELVGVVNENMYMGFGVSGSDQGTVMVGSDVAIAFMQGEEFFAVDYHMSRRSQCAAGEGVCPDEVRSTGNGVDNISNVTGEAQDGIMRISYTRPIAARDADLDRSINTDGPTFVSWATGQMNSELNIPLFHGPNVNVPDDSIVATPEPFERPVFSDVTEFTARIGPSGEARGVKALRGEAWGIAWYMSPEGSTGEDVLIPAIGVERGKTYRFNVYGGVPSDPIFHPLYITSNDRGGFETLSPEDRMRETIYAGINVTSQNATGIFEYDATAAGALCEFKTSLQSTSDIETYQEFYESLDTSCTQNESITANAGTLEWTVSQDTPNLVYYQCVTHELLGFEVHVFDEGQVDTEVLQLANVGQRTCRVTVNGEELTFQACTIIDSQTDYNVFWNINDDEIETLIRVRTDGYAGFGWGYDMMVPGNAAIVYRTSDDSAAIDDYHLSDRNRADVQPNTNQGLTNTAALVDGDFVIGRFTRKLSVADLPVISADSETSAIWSVGARPDSPTALSQHTSRGIATINLRRGSSISSGSGPSTFFIVHGVFMGLSWLLFVPTAIITMRFFKKHNPVTFQIHRALNGTSVILVVIAYFMGIARGNRVERAHLIIGSILFCLAVLQGLGGLFRPQKGTPARKPWYLGHASLGTLAWLLSIANVFLGIRIITDQGGSGERAWYAVAGIVAGLVVLLYVFLSGFPSRFPTRVEDDGEDVEEKLKAVPDNPVPI
eukprot:TRINITY_DN51_c0_g1_i1.p1 TRINITY_DN51_c0_g1~~TRINITY_DN51_c0_g1_i1.p1  ORF type:complete len:1114 (-),score=142.54 TRINITY_DN51_c0_g1_i1:4233-7574(-)